jgi:ketosteroid isomerase-like protein
MSRENVEIVGRMLDAFHRGDAEGAFALMDSDVVADFPIRPDSGLARGRMEVSAMVTDWVATFDEFEETTDEIRDLGDRVLVIATQRGRGKGSGVEVEQQYAWIYELRGSRITRLTAYKDAAAALKAADLSK